MSSHAGGIGRSEYGNQAGKQNKTRAERAPDVLQHFSFGLQGEMGELSPCPMVQASVEVEQGAIFLFQVRMDGAAPVLEFGDADGVDQ